MLAVHSIQKRGRPSFPLSVKWSMDGGRLWAKHIGALAMQWEYNVSKGYSIAKIQRVVFALCYDDYDDYHNYDDLGDHDSKKATRQYAHCQRK